jgi:hypothetical protein
MRKHLFLWAVVFVGWWLALHLGCNRMTGPTPIPTPTPTAEPTPTPTPSPTVKYRFGASNCCADDDPNMDEGLEDGWELATPEWLAYAASRGVSFVVFRTLDLAEQDKTPIRIATANANAVGIRPEIDLVDCWRLRNRLNAWNEGPDVVRKPPRAHHLRHVREVVAAVAGLNATFNLGNECYLLDVSKEWDRGLYNEAKAAGAGLVGSNSGRSIGDYFTKHGFEPVCNGEWLTESDNEVHSVEEWVDLYVRSRACGGIVFAWRGPETREKHDQILRAIWAEAVK